MAKRVAAKRPAAKTAAARKASAKKVTAKKVAAKAAPAKKESVGFIGVGLMGHGMAKNIVEKGYPLMVMAHKNKKPIRDLVKRGETRVHTRFEIPKKGQHIGVGF